MTIPAPVNPIGRAAAAGVVWQMIGFACVTVCGYVVAVLLARNFGPAVFGVYGVVYSVLMATELMLRFGVPQALTRLIGGAPGEGSVGLQNTGITLTLIVNLAGFAIFWMAAPYVAEALNVPFGTRLFRIAILDIPFYALFVTLSHILNGRRQFIHTGLALCVYGLVKVAGVIFMLMTDTLSIAGALYVNLASSVVGMVLLLIPAKMRAYRPSLKARASVVALAIPITIGEVGLQVLLGIDLWLLNALGTSIAADIKGDYVAAISLARLPNVVAYVLTAVLVPSIARALSAGERETAGRLVIGTMRFLAVLVLPVCTLIAANAVEAMQLLFSDVYLPGARFLMLLVFAQGLGYTLVSALLAILVGAGASRVAAQRIYIALTIAVAANLILIPLLGAMGAALAALVSFVIAAFLLARLVRQKLGVLLEWRATLLALLVSIAVGLAGWLIPATGLMLLVEVAVLGLAYLGIVWAIGLVSLADLAQLRRRTS
ncbi:MAG TPA: polysaccharide biosynthesis C-terminal domain-containing protein [Steroidobacteraceae bacterium]|nr:polysaccharide biosynthesis C-terminal domain-containing protein [Steroidobacteraceae bacterium]